MFHRLFYFMSFSAPSQPRHDDWQPDLVALASEFTIDKLKPHWPRHGALFQSLPRGLSAGRIEDWDTAQQRWTDNVLAEPSFETQLMFATLQLPIDLLQAAHKRLFGHTTEEPSEAAIRAIGFALFHCQTFGYAYRDGKTWPQYCKEANGSPAARKISRRERVKAAVADLLTELDD